MESVRIEVVRPYVQFLTPMEHIKAIPKLIEQAGRTCYQTQDKITDESADKFVRMLVDRGHLSVLEHCSVTVKFICDRATSHQLVRHRIAAYSQESQRYVSYEKDGTLYAICPPAIAEDESKRNVWVSAVMSAYRAYIIMVQGGVKPEDARSVLPNATKTEVVATYNLRQWRHVFEERALNPRAQLPIRSLTGLVLGTLGAWLPSVFGDQLKELQDQTN